MASVYTQLELPHSHPPYPNPSPQPWQSPAAIALESLSLVAPSPHLSSCYYSVKFFLSYLNDSSLQRCKILTFWAWMVISGKMDVPQCASESTKTDRGACLSPC